MESKEYIESGNLELYALDQLDAEGRKEVEAMAVKYPEVAEELKAIQAYFEKFAMENSIEPKGELKNRIEAALDFQESAKEGKETRVSPLNPNENTKSNARVISLKLYIVSLAACFGLLVVSTVSILHLSHQLEDTQNKYLTALNDSKKYASQTKFIEGEYQKSLEVQSDTNIVSLKLKGTKSYPGTVALVFWNKKSHRVHMTPGNLPKNDEQHSYQLWAIVNGKPVDEGTFNVENGFAALNTMKDRETAQAFAITLEPKGGSPSPHLDQLVGIVNI